jgi:hypothetical protein
MIYTIYEPVQSNYLNDMINLSPSVPTKNKHKCIIESIWNNWIYTIKRSKL